MRRAAVSVVVLGLLCAGGITATRAHFDGTASRAGMAAGTPASSQPTRPTGASPTPAMWAQPLTVPPATLAAAAGDGERPSAADLAALIAAQRADPALAGDQLAAVVDDAVTGTTLADVGGQAQLAPASTAKLAVAAAALDVLGPAHRFSTTVVQGAGAGSIVLVGGGDPTLAGPHATGAADPGYPEPARLADLAAEAAGALKARGVAAVQLGYDTSLFSGPATAPGWKPSYITEGDVAPVSALEVDEGRADPTKAPRVADPAALAAQDFAALLTADGVRVTGTAPTGATADAAVLASVQSPTLAALVQLMLGRSDNDLAEALARQLAIATGRPATFAGGAQAVAATLAHLGVDSAGLAMADGSGLSTLDRAKPAALAQVLELAVRPGHPQLAAILDGLPVAGFSGTLDDRYLSSPAAAAAGTVRAKTGTLDGVVTLVGYLDDASGRRLVFALFANGVKTGATATTEAALDTAAATLAGCGCH